MAEKASMIVTAAVVLLLLAVGLVMFSLRQRRTGLQHALHQKKHRVLLVIAHPDDESMFFAPTILRLRELHVPVWVLCLSTGNADGKGNVRKQELLFACEKLQVPKEKVTIIDDPGLQDGMQEVWPEHLLHKHMHACVLLNHINKIVTFDEQGVSSHPNHISTFQGVRSYVAWRKRADYVGHKAGPNLPLLQAFTLETTSLVRKYVGCLDILPSHLLSLRHPDKSLVVLNLYPWKGVLAMLQHRSQLVWYRWLFITLSRYTYVNTLKPLDHNPES